MENIPTTATALRKIKAAARSIRDLKNIPLSAALDQAAQEAGYEHFHHVTRCASGNRGSETVCLRITLDDVEPAVWREVLVSKSISLCSLHQVIQAVMGWTDSHLHEFVFDTQTYLGYVPLEYEDHEALVYGITLERALGKGKQFSYQYDFGDGWQHTIELRPHNESNTDQFKVCLAVFLQGANACPPEDVGGTPGYVRFLRAIRDPKHPEHREMLDWAPEGFDPARCDAEAIQGELQRIAYLATRQAELMNSKPLRSFDIELPKDAELGVIEYLNSEQEEPLFTAGDIQDFVRWFISEYYGEVFSALPDNWARRIVDAFIRRERGAGKLEFIGPGGPMSLWRVVGRD